MPETQPQIAALIVAAGRGARAGDGLPKQYRPLPDAPTSCALARAARIFLDHAAMTHVQIVTHADDQKLYDAALAAHPKLRPNVIGGATRLASVQSGLTALSELAPDYVLIHDGARPYVPHDLITRCCAALTEAEGAIPACAVTDTLKRVNEARIETIDRADVFAAQTPQAFHYAAICRAYAALPAATATLTDDASVAEAAGLKLALVEGAAENIKLTHAADFARPALPRFGLGYDVHRLAAAGRAREIMLGGIAIPHQRALIGHSDADVGLHALTDAILGALAAGDIGDHFPPSAAENKDRPSRDFLAHAAQLVQAGGGRIVHLDLTLVCETPKIAPHRAAMRAAIAEIVGLAPAQVSVKATTTEGLGFTGRGEAIAAHAAATLYMPEEKI